jgi:hypothetical protein
MIYISKERKWRTSYVSSSSSLVAFFGAYLCCENHFLLIKNYDKDEYICATNSAFALSWLDSTQDSQNGEHFY